MIVLMNMMSSCTESDPKIGMSSGPGGERSGRTAKNCDFQYLNNGCRSTPSASLTGTRSDFGLNIMSSCTKSDLQSGTCSGPGGKRSGRTAKNCDFQYL